MVSTPNTEMKFKTARVEKKAILTGKKFKPNQNKPAPFSYLPKRFDTQYSVNIKRNPMFGPAKFQNGVIENGYQKKQFWNKNRKVDQHFSGIHKNAYPQSDSSLFNPAELKKNV
jgi:hypothetical protein